MSILQNLLSLCPLWLIKKIRLVKNKFETFKNFTHILRKKIFEKFFTPLLVGYLKRVIITAHV
jgi:hypothetical protein